MKCRTGSYNPKLYGRGASPDCLECTPGMACTDAGLEFPDRNCSGNYYCLGGAARVSGTSPGTIEVCERGYYCPEGSPDQIPCPRRVV